MKHIVKGSEPQAFTTWKKRADADYSNLQGRTKGIVKRALLKDQGWICCYCEQRVETNDSHIEHLRPQSAAGVDPLDYDNMLCSCIRDLSEKEPGDPLHCGHKKSNETIPISPLNPGCEARFSFAGDGSISAKRKGDQATAETIETLGLDIRKLRDYRKKAIDGLLADSLSKQELKTLVAKYLEQDGEGRFNPFHSTIRQLLG